jgi:hypothetical protein
MGIGPLDSDRSTALIYFSGSLILDTYSCVQYRLYVPCVLLRQLTDKQHAFHHTHSPHTSGMFPFFLQLGQNVAQHWQAANFNPTVFPALARTALEECCPSENVDIPALLTEFLTRDAQPLQSQSGFGQPELIVFEHPRFYIQILFWLDGTTDIHQHTFSGAFHVLEGSSIHSYFAFLETEPVSAHVQVGNLRRLGTELLEKGSTVEIVSGKQFIHSLFHLETPSATVVIRTQNDPGTGPQFTYLPPHLAVDPFLSDSLTTRRKQVLDMLEALGDSDYPDLVIEMLQSLDFERGFFILQNSMMHLKAIGFWDDAWSVFEAKHGRLAPFVLPTLDQILRRDALVSLRASVYEVEHRFFLALMLSGLEREETLRLIASRYEGDPEVALTRWQAELEGTHEDAAWALQLA